MKSGLLVICAFLVGWSVNEVAFGEDSSIPRKPFPPDFPEFSHVRETAINGPGEESDFLGLWSANGNLLGELDKYTRDSIAEAFEIRMSKENDIHARILFAEIAAENGGKAAEQFLKELGEITDYHITLSRLDALSELLRRNPADWVFDAVHAALCDTRKVIRVAEYRNAAPEIDVSFLAREHTRICMVLAETRNSKAVPILIETMQRNPRDEQTMSALGAIRDPRGIPVLLELLQTQDKAIKEKKASVSAPSAALVGALGNLKVTEAVPTLLDYLHADYVIEALGRVGDERAIPPLKRIVDDPSQLPADPITKKRNDDALLSARMALIRLEKGDPVPKWIAILGDPSSNDSAKLRAIDEIRQQPDPRAISPLLSVIKSNSDLTVVTSSTLTLSFFKYKKAVEGLIDCFDVNLVEKRPSKEPPDTYIEELGRVLHQMTGQDFGKDKARWIKWWNVEGKNMEGLQ